MQFSCCPGCRALFVAIKQCRVPEHCGGDLIWSFLVHSGYTLLLLLYGWRSREGPELTQRSQNVRCSAWCWSREHAPYITLSHVSFERKFECGLLPLILNLWLGLKTCIYTHSSNHRDIHATFSALSTCNYILPFCLEFHTCMSIVSRCF